MIFRCTASKYIRRAGVWADIKVTGHRSIDALIKSYDLSMEGEGLANAAVAIGSGPDVAQGSAFQPVKLEKRKITEAGKDGEKFKKFAG